MEAARLRESAVDDYGHGLAVLGSGCGREPRAIRQNKASGIEPDSFWFALLALGAVFGLLLFVI